VGPDIKKTGEGLQEWRGIIVSRYRGTAKKTVDKGKSMHEEQLDRRHRERELRTQKMPSDDDVAWIVARRTSLMNSSKSVWLKMNCATFKPEKLIKCTKF
jgi:hypothetical protein